MLRIIDDLESMDHVEYGDGVTLTNDYIESPKSETTNSATPTCWETLQDEEFVPAFKSVDKVPRVSMRSYGTDHSLNTH